MVFAEAGLLGLPLIAAKVGGIPEIIQDGYNGFLVRKSIFPNYLKKIEWLYKNRDECKNMGKKSSIYVSQKFSKEQSISIIKRIYDNF
jgi:glycosyltransferase involved in cell wall biosynthesis